MKSLSLLPAIVGIVVMSGAVHAASPIKIVAAENFYGDIAVQIGGPQVTVSSILSNPDQDPHLFEISPSVARQLSGARIVIYNGADYDPWMPKLLGAVRAAERKVIVVADLVRKKAGDNPHIWYDPATMPALAKALAEELGAADPLHKADYQERLAQFEQSMRPIQSKVAALRRRLGGIPVTATESVFQYMFEALGMEVRNQSFQIAVMNDTEPSASDIANFEQDLKQHRVRLLVYNSHATDPLAERMVKLAKASNIPVVAATETEPPGKTYQAWMMDELEAVDHALGKP